MGEQYARYEAWLSNRRNRKDERERVPIVLQMAATCDSVLGQGRFTEEQAQFFVDGLNSDYALIRDNAIGLLKMMQCRGIDISTILLEVFKKKKASARLAVMSCLTCRAVPRKAVDELLIQGIADKGTAVRRLAGEVATYYYYKRWLVPFMEASAKKYPDEPILTYWLSLLRDGYDFYKNRDGSYHLSVLTYGGKINARDICEQDTKDGTLDQVVAEMMAVKVPGGFPERAPFEGRVLEEHRIVD